MSFLYSYALAVDVKLYLIRDIILFKEKCFWVLTNGIKSVTIIRRLNAGVAQLVEQLIRNQQVTGSSPVTSSNERERHTLSFSF